MLCKYEKQRNSNRIWQFQDCQMCKILENRKNLVWHLIMKEQQGNAEKVHAQYNY